MDLLGGDAALCSAALEREPRLLTRVPGALQREMEQLRVLLGGDREGTARLVSVVPQLLMDMGSKGLAGQLDGIQDVLVSGVVAARNGTASTCGRGSGGRTVSHAAGSGIGSDGGTKGGSHPCGPLVLQVPALVTHSPVKLQQRIAGLATVLAELQGGNGSVTNSSGAGSSGDAAGAAATKAAEAHLAGTPSPPREAYGRHASRLAWQWPELLVAQTQALASRARELRHLLGQEAVAELCLLHDGALLGPLLLRRTEQVRRRWESMNTMLPGLERKQALALLGRTELRWEQLDYLRHAGVVPAWGAHHQHTMSPLVSGADGSGSPGRSSSYEAGAGTASSGGSGSAGIKASTVTRVSASSSSHVAHLQVGRLALCQEPGAFLRLHPNFPAWQALRHVVNAAPGEWGWRSQFDRKLVGESLSDWFVGMRGKWTRLLVCRANIQAYVRGGSAAAKRRKVLKAVAGTSGSSRAADDSSCIQPTFPSLWQLQEMGGDEFAAFSAGLSMQLPPMLLQLPDSRALPLLTCSSLALQHRVSQYAAVWEALQHGTDGCPEWQKELTQFQDLLPAALSLRMGSTPATSSRSDPHGQRRAEDRRYRALEAARQRLADWWEGLLDGDCLQSSLQRLRFVRQVENVGQSGGSSSSSTNRSTSSSTSSSSSSKSSSGGGDDGGDGGGGDDGSSMGSAISRHRGPRPERTPSRKLSSSHSTLGVRSIPLFQHVLCQNESAFCSRHPDYSSWLSVAALCRGRDAWEGELMSPNMTGMCLREWLHKVAQGSMVRLQFLCVAHGGEAWKACGLYEAVAMEEATFADLFPDYRYGAWRLLLPGGGGGGGGGTAHSGDPSDGAGGDTSKETNMRPVDKGGGLTGGAARFGQSVATDASISSRDVAAAKAAAGKKQRRGSSAASGTVAAQQLAGATAALMEVVERSPAWQREARSWDASAWRRALHAVHRSKDALHRAEFLLAMGQAAAAGKLGQGATQPLLPQLTKSSAAFKEAHPTFVLWCGLRDAVALTPPFRAEFAGWGPHQAQQALQVALIAAGGDMSIGQYKEEQLGVDEPSCGGDSSSDSDSSSSDSDSNSESSSSSSSENGECSGPDLGAADSDAPTAAEPDSSSSSSLAVGAAARPSSSLAGIDVAAATEEALRRVRFLVGARSRRWRSYSGLLEALSQPQRDFISRWPAYDRDQLRQEHARQAEDDSRRLRETEAAWVGDLHVKLGALEEVRPLARASAEAGRLAELQRIAHTSPKHWEAMLRTYRARTLERLLLAPEERLENLRYYAAMGQQSKVTLVQGLAVSLHNLREQDPLFDTWLALPALLEGVPRWQKWWSDVQRKGPEAVRTTLSELHDLRTKGGWELIMELKLRKGPKPFSPLTAARNAAIANGAEGV